MKWMAAVLLVFSLSPVLAQQRVRGNNVSASRGTTAAEAPNSDTSYIDEDGAAHITRVMPIPLNLSPEAKRTLARRISDAARPQSLEDRRHGTDVWQAHAGEVARGIFPANVEKSTIAGVPVRMVTPASAARPGYVLVNIHGGGFNSDSGSLTETIPIANLTGMKVVAVLYRLAPEHPFPAGLDDVVAVYRELLKTYQPDHMVIYGTSAGAILTGEIAVKLKELHLPEPAALGIFSGMGDFSRDGDSWAMYSLQGLSGHLEPPKSGGPHDPEYVGSASPRDPVLSPLFADLSKLPPTLFISSGRDFLLSGTSILQRAFLRAGDDDTPLVVFEGLPHAFWNDATLPESQEADHVMAHFFLAHLKP